MEVGKILPPLLLVSYLALPRGTGWGGRSFGLSSGQCFLKWNGDAAHPSEVCQKLHMPWSLDPVGGSGKQEAGPWYSLAKGDSGMTLSSVIAQGQDRL